MIISTLSICQNRKIKEVKEIVCGWDKSMPIGKYVFDSDDDALS